MLLEAKAICKAYGQTEVLSGVTVRLERGQLVAYLGTNGAGKSTTVGILTGLLRASSGQISQQPGLKIGIVFQQSCLDAELTVGANLRSRFGLYKAVSDTWFEQLLDLFELRDLLGKSYGVLSGGQKRRVDIARALLHQPDLLFLDEPTTGLDIQTRQAVWKILDELRKDGLTIFLTTHYLEEAAQADRIYILEKGQVLAEGSARDLLQSYGSNRLIVTSSQLSKIQVSKGQPLSDTQLLISPVTSQEVLELIQQYRDLIEDFDYQKSTLDDVFLQLTGKEL